MSRLIKWIDSGRHMPQFLRDFHDQKDVFKLIAHVWPPKDGERPYCDWVTAHCYVIDRFL